MAVAGRSKEAGSVVAHGPDFQEDRLTVAWKRSSQPHRDPPRNGGWEYPFCTIPTGSLTRYSTVSPTFVRVAAVTGFQKLGYASEANLKGMESR